MNAQVASRRRQVTGRRWITPSRKGVSAGMGARGEAVWLSGRFGRSKYPGTDRTASGGAYGENMRQTSGGGSAGQTAAETRQKERPAEAASGHGTPPVQDGADALRAVVTPAAVLRFQGAAIDPIYGCRRR